MLDRATERRYPERSEPTPRRSQYDFAGSGPEIFIKAPEGRLQVDITVTLIFAFF